MPIRATFQESQWTLQGYIERLENPDALLMDLAEELVKRININAPRDSGELVDVATRIRGPFPVPGGRGIGIGDATATVDPSVRAPRWTIRDFLKEYRDALKWREEDKERRRKERELYREREAPLIATIPIKRVVPQRARWTASRYLARLSELDIDDRDRLIKERGKLTNLMSRRYEFDPTTATYQKLTVDIRNKRELIAKIEQRMADRALRIAKLQRRLGALW